MTRQNSPTLNNFYDFITTNIPFVILFSVKYQNYLKIQPFENEICLTKNNKNQWKVIVKNITFEYI